MPDLNQTADLPETVRKALHRAWNLGQTYWSQADSESIAQHRRSDHTRELFEALSAETVAAIERAISAAPTPACDSSGTVDCQSTAASHRCADCPHGGPVADEADQTIKCLPDGVMFDAFGNPRMRYVRVSYDGSHLILSLPEVEEWRMEAEAAAARVGQTDPHTYSDVYLSKEEADALPEFDGF